MSSRRAVESESNTPVGGHNRFNDLLGQRDLIRPSVTKTLETIGEPGHMPVEEGNDPIDYQEGLVYTLG